LGTTAILPKVVGHVKSQSGVSARSC